MMHSQKNIKLLFIMFKNLLLSLESCSIILYSSDDSPLSTVLIVDMYHVS